MSEFKYDATPTRDDLLAIGRERFHNLTVVLARRARRMGLDADEQHGESLGILVARLQELHDLEARCIDGLRDLLEEAAVRGADDE